MSSPPIELARVGKRFGTVAALTDLTLRIEEGETVALLGANGAGKTTAISLMVGLRRPTAGQVRSFGLAPANIRVRRRRGVMLQDCEPIDHLRVSEAIALFRSYYPRPLPTSDITRLAGLEGLVKRRADALSHGQRQRLFFAQAIAGDPELLFLDEPTAGMDVESRAALHEHLRSSATAGRTVLLTTHDLSEANTVAGRIVVLRQGRSMFDGPPAVLLERVGSLARVRFSAPPARVSLEGLPAARIELDQEMVTIHTSEPGAVVTELARRGIPMAGLAIEAPSLEDAYLRLVAEPK